MTDEITPARKFGLEGDPDGWLAYGGYFNDWVDPYRKTVRLVDMEHWVRCHRWFFIDLETGSIDPVPEDWTKVQVQRAIDYAQARGRPTILQKRPTKRLRWTQLIGNVVAYDSWSPYESVTTVPFFPYFRRGITRGLVHDLISPQDEINKRRSSRMNIVSRTANGGWIYEKHSLDPQTQTNLRLYGSRPGIHIPYNSHEGKYNEPKQISPPTPPEGMRQARARRRERPEGDQRHQRSRDGPGRQGGLRPQPGGPHHPGAGRPRDGDGQHDPHQGHAGPEAA